MYTTLSDFHADLDKVSRLLELTGQIKEFSGLQSLYQQSSGMGFQCVKSEIQSVEVIGEEVLNENGSEQTNKSSAPMDSNAQDIAATSGEDFTINQSQKEVDLVVKLHSTSRNNHSNLVILNGTLLLFITGRFESFVRDTFEEYCKNLTERVDKFSDLPNDMKVNLMKYTSEVISNPRRYGHADNGVKAFVRVMNNNLHDISPVEINYQCLSITSENMRAGVLSDLFQRAGVKNILEKLSQQSKLQLHWGSKDSALVSKSSEKYLNSLMELRNSIAHPSTSITWPDSEAINKALDFFRVFSTVLIDVLPVFELDVGSVHTV
ncbi:HEPN domain-containing protein [Erwinia sp. B116]|uniref:HEPN domain-containing protein n=1 Tax=Erwinia sp. B116 TaxID=1561024 RepID=UPI0011AFB182|nr:HEPN domain-containing protein [Erwinia sp. B116]